LIGTYHCPGSEDMAMYLKITSPKELDAVHDLIHDCYFDVDDTVFDTSSSVLSFRFRRPATRDRHWWKDIISARKSPQLIECFLRIYHVESYSINDSEKVGTYGFNVLVYDPSTRCIVVQTGVPIDIRVSVRDFEISVEVTDNLFEQTNVSGAGCRS
jgi:hypothetical protein